MKTPRFASIDDYLAALDEIKAKTIGDIFDLILQQFPELTAKISWNVPTIHRSGTYVAGISAHKNHITFSAWSADVITAFKARLAGYVMFKNCFQVPVDWQIDEELILALVRARLAELD